MIGSFFIVCLSAGLSKEGPLNLRSDSDLDPGRKVRHISNSWENPDNQLWISIEGSADFCRGISSCTS